MKITETVGNHENSDNRKIQVFFGMPETDVAGKAYESGASVLIIPESVGVDAESIGLNTVELASFIIKTAEIKKFAVNNPKLKNYKEFLTEEEWCYIYSKCTYIQGFPGRGIALVIWANLLSCKDLYYAMQDSGIPFHAYAASGEA